VCRGLLWRFALFAASLAAMTGGRGAPAWAAGLDTPSARFPFVPTGRLDPDQVNVLAAADADRTGEFSLTAPITHLKTEIVGWKSADQAISWTVFAPSADDYSVAALLRMTGRAPVSVSVSTASSSISAPVRPGPKGVEDRTLIDAPLHLVQGRNVITLRFTPSPRDAPFAAEVLALELTRPQVRAALHQHAVAMRADVRWMGRAPLGLAFTWTKRTMPRRGPQLPYGEAVARFDVERFANDVASTGASFVVFSTSHSDQYMPGPNAALDAILPGRTAKRDLIADLIKALGQRHIKLFLYYHLGPVEDPAWSKATHMWDSDPTRFFNNWKAIVSDMGARYGAGVAGFWFDDGLYNYYYRSPDWEALYRAAKVGDPDRAVCFNSWNGASATEFQDYYCGEETTPGGLNDNLNHDGSFNGALLKDGDGRFVRGQFEGLQAATMFVVENDWLHTQRDTEAAAPKWTPQSLAATLLKLKAYHVAPMVNMLIYQDGTIAPKSLAVVREAAILAGVGAKFPSATVGTAAVDAPHAP